MTPWARNSGWIIPDWPAPMSVRSLITTRTGGVSSAPYTSLNLADHVGDDPLAVTENRRQLCRNVPAAPCWLNQEHGTTVVDAKVAAAAARTPLADAAFARDPSVVCAVMTADCLPVLLCDESGSVVAAAHAGWRGLHAGILERTVAAMKVPRGRLLAYLGPAIGPQAFEVGDEVRCAFISANAGDAAAFQASPDPEQGSGQEGRRLSGSGTWVRAGGWMADIYLLARRRLARVGVEAIYGGGYCTVGQESRFFSYRRDGVTGRMASLIWLCAD